MEEIVIQRVYSILLSCCKKYDIKDLETCMHRHVRKIVNESMAIVQNNPNESEQNKKKIMNKIIHSLAQCAEQSYKNDHDKKRLYETIECIKNNIKGLISTSVDAMSTLISMNQQVKSLLLMN